jgi:hypothetical protein
MDLNSYLLSYILTNEYVRLIFLVFIFAPHMHW